MDEGNVFFRTDYLTMVECIAKQDEAGRELVRDICTELQDMNGGFAGQQPEAETGYGKATL